LYLRKKGFFKALSPWGVDYRVCNDLIVTYHINKEYVEGKYVFNMQWE